jgi:nitrite reductase/ring-hydroxylating ferredoxin subunit/uncharacterized membrane protein
MNPLAKLVDKAAHDPRLDRVADRLSRSVDGMLAKARDRQGLEDALHGKWLGHPLHTVLTDLPIGAWSLAGALDGIGMLTGHPRSMATGAIQFGVLASIPTAMAGAVDWRATDGEARRVGAAHAVINSGALSLYVGSLVVGRRNLGLARLLSFGGLGLVAVSGYFGGHLLSHYRVGVRHATESASKPLFSETTLGEGLQEDRPDRREIDGTPMVVVKYAGRVYALADVCPHLGCSLSKGSVAGASITCPCHGSTFSLEDGRVLRGPSVFPVESYKPWTVSAEATPAPILDAGTE